MRDIPRKTARVSRPSIFSRDLTLPSLRPAAHTSLVGANAVAAVIV